MENQKNATEKETTKEKDESVAEPENDKVSPRDNDNLMFAFDKSPHDSPRDLPSRASAPEPPKDLPSGANAPDFSKEGASVAATDASPSNSPRPKKLNRSLADSLTQSSPPRFVSFDEIMKAADGVTNMVLAHEIAVDHDFRFKKQEPDKDSLEQRVRDIMHRAFWDVLEEKLREDPPDYSQALVLLQEVRETVLEQTLPHQVNIRGLIDEVLDMELIEQKADHRVLDIQYYADFIISIMAKMCAPVRDEEIVQLGYITEIVPLFKAIFRVLDLMKLDMANFTIQQMRPLIQNQSVEYEKSKFKQLLAQQKENHLDGLEYTKAWLQRASDLVCQEVAALPGNGQSPAAASSQSPVGTQSSEEATSKSPEGATYQPSGGPVVVPPGVSPVAVLNTAYMELLRWQEDDVFPETLLMDGKRFLDLSEKVRWLALVASVLMVTYNTVGDPVAGIRSFKEKIKNDIAIIISATPFDDVKLVMPNVAQHVLKEVQRCLVDHGYPPLHDDRVKLLQGLIESVSSPSQPVHKCLSSRLMKHIQKLLATPRSQQIQVAPGFAAMAEEFSHVYGQFLRLVSHNKSVYGAYYAEIITTLLREKVEETSL